MRKSISEELAAKKSYFVNTRFSIDDLATLELIRRITASPSRSEAIRLALKIAYGVLAGASEVKAGRIVIQNPIVNLNINNNHNEVRPEVNVNVDLQGILEVVEKLYNLRQPLPPVQRKLVEQLYRDLRKIIN